jgi:hypothetical protein
MRVRGAVIGLLFAGSAAAQMFLPVENVSFSIRAEKTYRIGETITIPYRIENKGKAAIYVPREFKYTHCLDPVESGPHIWGRLLDSAGRPQQGGWASSCGGSPDWSPSMSERLAKIAILLKPGEHTDGSFEFDPTTHQAPVGRDRVEITLRGWDAERFSKVQLLELGSMEPLLQGTVQVSAEITILGN